MLSILQNLVIPYFIGKDARDLEFLIDGVYTYGNNYKYSGMPFWDCVAHVEFSLLDALVKTAGKTVGTLLGTVQRPEISVYLSSMRRDTTPEEEVAFLERRVAETKAGAVKIKIGGRMSKNADASPGRTDRLIPLARQTLGPDVAIYVDANGSYDAQHAIEVGRLPEAHGVGFFEEPCPFEDYVATKLVTDTLQMTVAGGEQDTSLPHFQWLIDNRAVDLVQPDLAYNGGFDTKEKLIRWLHDNATMPAGVYWDYQLVQNYRYPRALNGEEPLVSKLKAAEDELIPIFDINDIHVVVVSGETNGYWRIMGTDYQKTVSIDDWR